MDLRMRSKVATEPTLASYKTKGCMDDCTQSKLICTRTLNIHSHANVHSHVAMKVNECMNDKRDCIQFVYVIHINMPNCLQISCSLIHAYSSPIYLSPNILILIHTEIKSSLYLMVGNILFFWSQVCSN